MTEFTRELEYADLFDSYEQAYKRTLDALAPKLIQAVMAEGGSAVVDITVEKKDFPERSILTASVLSLGCYQERVDA
jgi:hypothetical protein